MLTRDGMTMSAAERRLGRHSEISAYTRNVLRALCVDIGERHLGLPTKLNEAADFIADEFANAGATIRRESFVELRSGWTCHNIVAEVRGTVPKPKILVVGAHYDSVPGSPGANDNASGIAALLQLARSLGGKRGSKTVRFVAFCNEEEPYFDTPSMGSRVHAEGCRSRGDDIFGAIVLECLGIFRHESRSQDYPFPLKWFPYPSRGDFLLVVSNPKSLTLQRRVKGVFVARSSIAALGLVAPMAYRPARLSDHISFYRAGYRAVMITDTGPFRSEHYHRPSDTIEHIDFGQYVDTIVGLEGVVEALAY